MTPTVFKSQAATSYGLWQQHAVALGRASEWRAWSEDETCAQRNIGEDVEAPREATPYCQLSAPPQACTDALEPNNTRAAAKPGVTTDALKICAGDDAGTRRDGRPSV